MSISQIINVQLCSDYSIGCCALSSCSKLHFCKEFLISGKKCHAKKCQYGFSHDPLDSHNITIMRTKKLEHRSRYALTDLLRQSFPRLCRYFNDTECSRDQCKKLHLCIKEGCTEGNCGKSHNVKDSHNMRVLIMYSLDEIDHMKTLVLNILVSKKIQHIFFNNLDSLCVPKISQMKNSMSDDSTKTVSVHNFLNGKNGVSLKVLQNVFPQIKNLKNVLENAPSLFWIGKNSIDDWEVRGIGRIRLCFFYLYKTCRGNCGCLHLCKDYLLAKKFCESILCKYGFSHDIADEHNTMVMRDAGLSHFSNLRASFPRLCTNFAETGSCVKFHCGYMHVCPEYLLGNCSEACKFSIKTGLKKESTHNYNSPHNKTLLKKFGFFVQKKDWQTICTNVLIPKLIPSLFCESLSKRTLKKTHANDRTNNSMMKRSSTLTSKEISSVKRPLIDRTSSEREPSKLIILICTYYLRGNCKKGNNCSRLHLCKDFLIHKKRCTDICKHGFSHDLLDANNSKIMKKNKVDKLPIDKMLTLLRKSFPFVCRDYVLKGECITSQCGMIHLCCEDNCVKEKCNKSHDLKDNHNHVILRIYSLDQLIGNGEISNDDFIFTNILFSAELCNELVVEEVFHLILKKHSTGECTMSDPSLLDYFNNDEDFAEQWFKENLNEFRISVNRAGIKTVHLCPLDIRPCYYYWRKKMPCQKLNCSMFHICSDLLIDCSHDTSSCPKDHDLSSPSNKRLISSMKYSQLTKANMISLLKIRYPFVCLAYQTNSCWDGEDFCESAHICVEFIKADCNEECSLDHEKALTSQQANRLMSNYHLDENIITSCLMLPTRVNYVFPPFQQNYATHLCSTRLCNQHIFSGLGNYISLFRRRTSHVLERVFSESACNLFYHAVSCAIKEVKIALPVDDTEVKIIQMILEDNKDGFIKLGTIFTKSELLSEVDSEKWFEKRKDVFRLRSDTSSIKYVHLCIDEIKPCPNYWEDKCSSSKCEMFHICKEYIFDSIHNKRKCAFNHDFKDSHNARVISNLVFKFLTEDDLMLLLKIRYPVVCTGYQYNSCPDGEPFCSSFHVCYDYMAGQCKKKDSICKWKHESAFTGNQAHRLMEEFHLNLEEFKSCIILPKTTAKHERYKSDIEAFDSWKEEAICFKFLTGDCDDDDDERSCSLLHPKCKLPYMWQYKESNDEHNKSWVSFPMDMNEEMEKQFCDPMRDKWTGINKLSCSSYKLLHENRCNTYEDVPGFIKIRRLSTKSSALTTEQHVGLTDWKWYWNEGPSKWSEYTLGTSSKDLEIAYGRENLTTYRFKANKFKYTISFDEMIQNNEDPRYLTKRHMRRRPMFKSTEQIKSLLQRSSFVPDHWPKLHLEGEKITITYSKYKKIKEEFELSVSRSVLVLDIQEICNEEHYEAYYRRKEKFLQKSLQPNEMMLYHGTDSSVIDNICADNFEWRLCGKNATAYGKGSYFATTASYSHGYVVKDDSDRCYIFVASVLTGQTTVGTKAMLIPPLLPGSERERYDSCTNNTKRPSIYVIFYKDQCYPRYLITYKERADVNYKDILCAENSVRAAGKYEIQDSSDEDHEDEPRSIRTYNTSTLDFYRMNFGLKF